MDIKQLKASVKLAELRFKSNSSDDNFAILKAATEAYEFALDPEKKTEDEADHKPEPEAPKPAATAKPAAAPKAPSAKPAAPKVETTSAATQPEPSTPLNEQQPATEAQQPAQETATTALSDPA